MLHFLFFWHGNFACCNLVAENTIFKSPKTQIKTHHTKPMFWATTFTTDLDSMQYKNNGWEKWSYCPIINFHDFQDWRYMPGISPKSAQKNPWNLPRTSSKSVRNVPEICRERLGDGQQVPESPMKSRAIWVSFLRVPKSPVRGNGGYAGFFGGDGSPCNIVFNAPH